MADQSGVLLMIGFSYVIPRDYGFAPNPFGEFCTLATCKPRIRKNACVDDWVFGWGSAKHNLKGKLVFAMCVSEKISFETYWTDARFAYKKPLMDGSLKQMYGDNIYFRKNGKWQQLNSHHSNDDGSVNKHNLNRDTKENSVLISTNFYYFGSSAIDVPEDLSNDVVKTGIGEKIVPDNAVESLTTFLNQNYSVGITGFPTLFNQFARYDGVS